MTKRHGVRQDDTNQRPEEVAFALRKEDVEDGRDRVPRRRDPVFTTVTRPEGVKPKRHKPKREKGQDLRRKKDDGLTTQEMESQRPEAGSVPTPETLPLTPKPPAPTIRGESHATRQERKGCFRSVPTKRTGRGDTVSQTPLSSLRVRQTKLSRHMEEEQWRHTRETPKVRAKRARAERWLAKQEAKRKR